MTFLENLSHSKLFSGIDRQNLSELLTVGHRRSFESGKILFHEGTPALTSYLVLKGRLKLSKLHEDGKEVLVRYIHPGEMTAAVSVFKGKDYPVTAQSVDSTETIGWDRDTMVKLMTAYP